jgi:hypothetical protein
MKDFSMVSLEEALCEVIRSKQATLIEDIGVETVSARITELINIYGLHTKDCPYPILLAAVLFLGSDVKTCVDVETK